MSRLRMRLGETRKRGEEEEEEEEERGSSLVQSVTSSQKWKKRFLDTTGKREMGSNIFDLILLTIIIGYYKVFLKNCVIFISKRGIPRRLRVLKSFRDLRYTGRPFSQHNEVFKEIECCPKSQYSS